MTTDEDFREKYRAEIPEPFKEALKRARANAIKATQERDYLDFELTWAPLDPYNDLTDEQASYLFSAILHTEPGFVSIKPRVSERRWYVRHDNIEEKIDRDILATIFR